MATGDFFESGPVHCHLFTTIADLAASLSPEKVAKELGIKRTGVADTLLIGEILGDIQQLRVLPVEKVRASH